MLPKDFFKKVYVVDCCGKVTPATKILQANDDKIEVLHNYHKQTFYFNSQNNMFESGLTILVFDLFSEETRNLIEDRVIKRSAEIQKYFRNSFENYLKDMKSFRDVVDNNEKIFKDELNLHNNK